MRKLMKRSTARTADGLLIQFGGLVRVLASWPCLREDPRERFDQCVCLFKALIGPTTLDIF